MYKEREKVFWFSLISRFSIIILQTVFNAICPDHKADAFQSPEDPDEEFSYLDKIVGFMFKGLTRWDAQYYIHIAKYGYTYENTLAFFPLFPMSMKYFAMLLNNVLLNVGFPVLNHTNTIVIAGVVINLICFIKAALILYDLSIEIFKNTKVAYRTAILFCINPASIFFTALYSESIFVYLTFYSMLESIRNNPCVFLPLSLSSLVRSNGLVNFGFPLYNWLKNFLINSLPNYVSENKYYHASVYSLIFNSRHIILSLLQGVFQITLCFLPFCLFQIYNHSMFCNIEFNTTVFPVHVQKFAVENNLLLPGKSELPWCNHSIPIAYSYVQKKYWNVGFLNYYQFKQIPNFILALPVLYLFMKCVIEFFKQHKSKFFTLEFYTGVDKLKKSDDEKYPLDVFAFAVHGLVLTLVCILFVHIQVSTRLLCSASPLLYWYCALVTFEEEKLSSEVKQIEYETNENLFSKWKLFFFMKKHYSCTEKLIYGYFLGYFIVGCFMYSNFLPWT